MKYGEDYTIYTVHSTTVHIYDDEDERKRRKFEDALIDAGIRGWLEYCDGRIHDNYVEDIYVLVDDDGEKGMTREEVERLKRALDV